MKRRPLSIVIITIIYLLEPVGNVLLASLVNDMPLFGRHGILNHLYWSDWVVLCLFPIVAVGVYRVRKWGWYLFMAFSALLVGYNLVVYFFFNPLYTPETILLFILIVTAVSALFLRKHIYSPYFNPRLRWWETAPRYRVILESDVSTKDGSFHCETLDISESGCFIETAESITEGEPVWIRIHCKGVEINCLGRVVRKARPKEKTPGYGIMFQDMAAETRKRVRNLVWTLERLEVEDRKDVIPEARLPEDLNKREYSALAEIAFRMKSYLKGVLKWEGNWGNNVPS